MTGEAVLRVPRSARWLLAGIIAVAVLAVIALVPVSTRQSVNFTISTHDLPLYAKVLGFFDRDANYRRLSRVVTAGETTDEGRLLAVLRWTRANVRDVPPGFPVVDDHVWDIIVRGYGQDDQKTDVAATLATYAGVPTYWMVLRVDRNPLPVALARVEGRWCVLDVANDVVFRNRGGGLATPDELRGDPGLVAAAGGPESYRGVPYATYLAGVAPMLPPATLRAEKQMPWPRLIFEVRRVFASDDSRAEP